MTEKRIANRLPEKFIASLSLGENLLNALGVESCPALRSGREIAHTFKRISDYRHEVVISGALDSKCRLLHWSVLAVGSNEQTTVRVADAFLGAIQTSASGIFLVHNHPSDSLEPSQQDFNFTARVAEAGITLGYPLIDHVIVTQKNYRSILTPITLSNHRNLTPFAYGRVSDADRDADVEITWCCQCCGSTNSDTGVNGIHSFASSVCRPVRCDGCRTLNWLLAK